jgi:multidrug efflux pump subunit AcrA (membrane-fusion protein)
MNQIQASRRWSIPSSLFILCLAGGVWAATSSRLPGLGALFAQSSAEPITYTIRKSAFTVTIPASGELEAATATQISVPNVRTGGLKVFWIVKDGSLVRKGDTLVEFDASELLQQMEETERIIVIERKQHETKKTLLQQSLGSLKILAPHDGLNECVADVEIGRAAFEGENLRRKCNASDRFV